MKTLDFEFSQTDGSDGLSRESDIVFKDWLLCSFLGIGFGFHKHVPVLFIGGFWTLNRDLGS